MDRYDDAIREAKRAIALDPEYGNPYNDIGVYLMAQEELDEAIPWLMRATQAKRYARPHYPWVNLGHIWVLKEEWGKALSSYEEVCRLAPEYPIPVVPAVEAALFLPPEEARKMGTMVEQQAVTEAITKYFEAWSIYDADTLEDYSDPLNTEASIALLLHMAAAKHAGVTTTVHDTELLHLEGNIAVVKTSVSVVGKPQAIWHLLRQTNGTWKVVIRLFTEFPIS